uniref:Uncharacterized protein n=1 Tax=candidate division WWE3 bacterium TaxID=2053526 RepID=A0A831Z026_UNCKA
MPALFLLEVAAVVLVFAVIFCLALVTDNEHIAQMVAMDTLCGDDPMSDPYIKGYLEAYEKGFFAVLKHELRHMFS